MMGDPPGEVVIATDFDSDASGEAKRTSGSGSGGFDDAGRTASAVVHAIVKATRTTRSEAFIGTLIGFTSLASRHSPVRLLLALRRGVCPTSLSIRRGMSMRAALLATGAPVRRKRRPDPLPPRRNPPALGPCCLASLGGPRQPRPGGFPPASRAVRRGGLAGPRAPGAGSSGVRT